MKASRCIIVLAGLIPLQCGGGGGSASAPENQAPQVHAGTDQTITLPDHATLAGSLSDDGLPNPPGAVSYYWYYLGTPEEDVVFEDKESLTSTVSFAGTGVYSLRLQADDYKLSAADDITITVLAPSNAIFVDSTLSADLPAGDYSIENRDNSGSDGPAYNTLQEAIDVANAGDTIYIRAGTYVPIPSSNDYVARMTSSGSSGSPITICSYDNENVILDASTRKYGLWLEGADFITIRGLEIQNGTRSGVYVLNSTDCIVEHNVIHDFRDTTSVSIHTPGIYLKDDSPRGIVRYNEVYDCAKGIELLHSTSYLEDCLVEFNYIHDLHWFDELGAYNDTNADGIVCNRNQSTLIRRNVVARCGDDGMDIYDSLSCEIKANIAFNCGDVLSGSASGSGGDGNGFKSTTGGGGGHLFANNISFNNEQRGFDQDHVDTAAPGNNYYNNVAYGNGSWGWLIEKASSTDTVLRNNIGYLNATKDIRIRNTAPCDSDYNFWADGLWPNDSTQIEFPSPTAHSLSGNPMLVSPPTAAIPLDPESTGVIIDLNDENFATASGFALSTSSPCKNAGEDVGIDFNGTAPDMGAIESD